MHQISTSFIGATLGLFALTALGQGHVHPNLEICARNAYPHALHKPHAVHKGGKHPQRCFEHAGAAIVDFCQNYVYTTTTTATQRLATTRIETTTSTTQTTTTEFTTTTSTSTTATTTTTSYRGPGLERRDTTLAECPDLFTDWFSRLPAAKVSELCSCLGITVATAVRKPHTTLQVACMFQH